MDDFGNLLLTNAQCLIIALFCAFAIRCGRVELLLGPYLVLISSARTIVFGPVALFWILAASIVCSMVVGYMRESKQLGIARLSDRWILFWMASWWAWMLLLLFLFRPLYMDQKLRNLLMYIWLPIIPAVFIAKDMNRVRRFAWSYVAASIVNGAILLYMPIASENIRALELLDENPDVQRFIHNYHRIAVCFGIAIVFSFALTLTEENKLARALACGLGIMLAFPFYYTGSRHMIVAAVVSLVVFVAATVKQTTRGTTLINVGAIGLFILVGAVLYEKAGKVFVRGNPEFFVQHMLEAFEDRLLIWKEASTVYFSSPVWGGNFSTNAHNLFLGTLVTQGFMGFTFLLVFLFFAIRQIITLRRQGLDGRRTIWTNAFMGVIIYEIVRSQVSGDAFSIWHIYWATAMIWCVASFGKESLATCALPTRNKANSETHSSLSPAPGLSRESTGVIMKRPPSEFPTIRYT